MKKIFFVIVLSLSTQVVFAQENKIKFGSMQQLVLNIEADQVMLSPNIVNGIRYKKWFWGLGISYDYLYFNRFFGEQNLSTMPVYAQSRFYPTKTKKFFILGEAGINFIIRNQVLQNEANDTYKLYKGYVGGFGLGYKVKIANELYYTIDIHQNFKQTKFNHDYLSWDGSNWLYEKNDFRQGRILLRMGLEF